MHGNGILIQRGNNAYLSEIKNILWEHEMVFSGGAKDYMVLFAGNKAVGCFKYVLTSMGFHLEVVAVASERIGQGLGSMVINWLKRRNKNITVIANKDTQSFYRKSGFLTIDYNVIPKNYQIQCAKCSYKIECSPMPMFFLAGKEVIK